MYPEGSRLFLIKESCIRFAEKLGLQPLKHCAHPRTGAAHAVMDVLAPSQDDVNISRCGARPPVEYIIDATLGYAKGDVPNIGSIPFFPYVYLEASKEKDGGKHT
uniref:Amidohydro-rel domain-containing protein n=1 Tax=Heterorhabditis bacteriophora TaxID=37862 RepID=A0A1I7WSQ7_HETBA